jgi:hypothetical protein
MIWLLPHPIPNSFPYINIYFIGMGMGEESKSNNGAANKKIF